MGLTRDHAAYLDSLIQDYHAARIALEAALRATCLAYQLDPRCHTYEPSSQSIVRVDRGQKAQTKSD